MNTLKKIVSLGICGLFLGCAPGPVDTYRGTTPVMDVKAYFDGPIQAWGLVQDWRGRAVRRFTIEMVGTWDGDVGTLTEAFVYDDGTTQNRVWTITKLSDGTYEGTAADVLDKATGRVEGSAARWSYVIDLPVADTTYRLRFDDWMWRVDDDVLINRSYMKKFGITVGELTIFMRKKR